MSGSTGIARKTEPAIVGRRYEAPKGDLCDEYRVYSIEGGIAKLVGRINKKYSPTGNAIGIKNVRADSLIIDNRTIESFEFINGDAIGPTTNMGTNMRAWIITTPHYKMYDAFLGGRK